MDFENFCKNNNVNKVKELEQNLDPSYEELINKYKNMSKQDLYAEFLKVASTQKAKGNLNKQELNNIYSSLAPYMNETEKQTIQNLLNKIG